MEQIPIWGAEIPGNAPREKRSVLELGQTEAAPDILAKTIAFAMAISHQNGGEYRDCAAVIDDFSWHCCIRRGVCAETFEDVPTLIPYPVPGSDSAVIILPGGGYGYLSIDLEPEQLQSEGVMVARRLNEAGISAYILRYRYHPYTMPIPLLDVQRAVRHLRANAAAYGLHPDKIGLVGFSAGGYQAAGYVNLLQGRQQFPAAYTPDAVDLVDDRVRCAAMFYPMLSFRHNQGGLFSAFPRAQVRDAAARQQLIEQYDLPLYPRGAATPQFLAQGTEDILVRVEEARAYARAVQDRGGPLVYLELPGANHGFTHQPDHTHAFAQYLDWCRGIFAQADHHKE